MDEAEIVAAMVAEIQQHEHPMTLVLRPQSVIQLVGLLQLALRHPGVSDDNRRMARMLIEHARGYFTGCPAILDVIRRGDDPREDR